jgi:hypothetical protein
MKFDFDLRIGQVDQLKQAFYFFLMLIILKSAGNVEAAETYRREVSFEWDPVAEAVSYEIELIPKSKTGRTYHFKTKAAQWAGKLKVGHYQMRARTLDRRGVPGEWGEAAPFDVLLDPTRLISPTPNFTLEVKESAASETDVHFKWAPVGGAQAYRLKVNGKNGDFKIDEILESTEIHRKLPTAEYFSWSVSAIGSDEIPSEENKEIGFLVQGPKLAKPEITKPQNPFVRELNWQKDINSEAIDLEISRWDPVSQKWELISESKDIKVESFPFDAKWPGGKYKAVIVANGRLRPSSEPESLEFDVFNGDRSATSEFNHEIRQSIDRSSGWYGVASYFVTQVQYTSENYDHTLPAQTTYNALSGTTRAGLGYFQEGSRWGFLGLVDFSSVNTSQGNRNSFSSEVSAVFRMDVTDLSQLRLQGGVFLKEYLVTESDGLTQTVVSYDKAGVVGPHLGLEYWYSLTPAFGFQANIHLYEGLLKTSTPNGQSLEPSLSTQIGILGSYRFNRKLTGLMGVAQREDKVRYSSSGVDPRSFGQVNQVVIKGTFLNLFAEYNF